MLTVVDDLIPGVRQVSENSHFEAVASAVVAEARVSEKHSDLSEVLGLDQNPTQAATDLESNVFLSGEWVRRAFDDDPDPLPVAPSLDDYEWDRVFVPDNFGVEPALSQQFGPVFYRRRLEAVDSPRLTLVFNAVDYLADVWLDGEHLGHHEGYFAPFSFDVTGKVKTGSVLTVRVQDPYEDLDPDLKFAAHPKSVIKGTMKYHDSRPGGLPGTFGYTPKIGQSLSTGGITEPALLLGTGEVRIDSVFITPIDHESGEIHLAVVATNLSDAPIETSFAFDISRDRATDSYAPDGDVPEGFGYMSEREGESLSGVIESTLAPGPNRFDLRAVVENPTLWWPISHRDLGRSTLYWAMVTAITDGAISHTTVDRFGIRTANVVETDRSDGEGSTKALEVNGREVFVQAVNYIPHQHFSTVDVDFYRRDMKLAADAHLNSLGVHGHIQSPKCYAAADEEGFLVFQDFALQWHYDSGEESNPGFVDKACRQIAEMAYTYWNHPSIVYWACHNEPMALFFPGKEPDAALDLDNKVLDAALEESLSEVDALRHVHRASGIGDDLHLYDGSLAGGSVYGVRNHESWFVSEFGFWAAGPQSWQWNDLVWPPDDREMKEWFSRMSFLVNTMCFTGLPDRYPTAESWQAATDLYAGFLAKYQTEWMRIRRSSPFNAYRWHFFADWWAYSGGGLVDVTREPKAAYFGLMWASRPLLAATSADRTVFEPGSKITFPIFGVNERRRPFSQFEIKWRWVAASESIVIGADDDVAGRYTTWMPAKSGSMVVMPAPDPWHIGAVIDGEVLEQGRIVTELPPESSTQVGVVEVEVPKTELASAVLELEWMGEEKQEFNWFQVLAAPEGWFCGPGAFLVSPDLGTLRLGDPR